MALILMLKEHTDTFEKMVCASPVQDMPKTLNVSIDCPDHCRVHELNTNQFSINASGKMSINATHQYSNVRKDLRPNGYKVT